MPRTRRVSSPKHDPLKEHPSRAGHGVAKRKATNPYKALLKKRSKSAPKKRHSRAKAKFATR